MRSGLPYGNANAAIWPCQARGFRAPAAFGQPMTQPACTRCRHPPGLPPRPAGFTNPDAVLIGLGVGRVMQSPGVRAAHVAEMDVACFIAHLGRMGIAAIQLMAV